MHYSDFSCYKLASGVRLLRFWCQLYGLPTHNWKAQPTTCGMQYIKTSTKTCVASKHCSRKYGVACAPNNLSRIAYSDFPCQKSPAARLPRLRYSDFWSHGPTKRGVLRAVPNRLLRFSLSEIPGRLPPRTPLLRFGGNFRTQMWPGGPPGDQSR